MRPQSRTTVTLFGRAITLFVCLLVVAVVGCGGEEDLSSPASIAERFCLRGDDCNMLTGASINDCAEHNEQGLSQLTASELADARAQIDDCLDLQSCSNFENCIVRYVSE